MARIEKYLHEHFASMANGDDNAGVDPSIATQPAILPDSYNEPLGQAFAKVNSVAAGSPAEEAGLKPADEIRSFGYVNHANHDNLKKVAECVQGNEGVCPYIEVSLVQGFLTGYRVRF